MPRPRFEKLAAAEQQAILLAALDEFSARGFNAASLNRIIETAGISKGSMYYYFDGKDDLYAHVARVELGRLIEGAGPFAVPTAREPDAFWSTLEGYYLSVMGALVASPKLAALARDWLVASASPALQRAQREMEQALVPWLEATLAAGQRARAVRKDVPVGLLVALVAGMGQAMDGWLVTQALDQKSFRKMARLFIEMVRRAVAP